MWMVMAASFIIESYQISFKRWMSTQLFSDKRWTIKLQNIQMNFKYILLRKSSQLEKAACRMIPVIWCSEKAKTVTMINRTVSSWGRKLNRWRKKDLQGKTTIAYTIMVDKWHYFKNPCNFIPQRINFNESKFKK